MAGGDVSTVFVPGVDVSRSSVLIVEVIGSVEFSVNSKSFEDVEVVGVLDVIDVLDVVDTVVPVDVVDEVTGVAVVHKDVLVSVVDTVDADCWEEMKRRSSMATASSAFVPQ